MTSQDVTENLAHFLVGLVLRRAEERPATILNLFLMPPLFGLIGNIEWIDEEA